MEGTQVPMKPPDVVVIHPGSRNLRIGRATDPAPKVFFHCIARKQKQKGTTNTTSYIPKQVTSPRIAKFIEDKASQLSNLLTNSLTSDGTPRCEAIEKVSNIDDVILDINLSMPDPKAETFFAEDAFNLTSNPEYSVNWPIRKGRLNLHKGAGGSCTAAIHDLHDIWRWALQKQLGLNPKEMNAILVIGDIYIGEHVKKIVDMLFNDMGFKKIFLHLEGICAAFGACLTTACVVDVGHSKSSVSCIEDGISLKSTRILLEFGGADITQLMHQLCKKQMPSWLDPERAYDVRLLERIKERFCHLDLDLCGSVDGRVIYQANGSEPQHFHISMEDEAIIAVLGIFASEILTFNGPQTVHMQAPQAADPQDPHDDFYLLQTQRRRGDAEFDEPEDEDGVPNDLKDPVRQETISSTQTLGLDIAILQSIDRCDSEDLKRKMLANIVVVGGGLANFHGVTTWLRNRIAAQTSKILRTSGDMVDVTINPKDLPGDCCAWRGAALVAQLDTSQELWISAKDWQKYGSKVLRERCVFGW